MHAKRYGLLNNMLKKWKMTQRYSNDGEKWNYFKTHCLEWFWNESIRPFSIFRIIFFLSHLFILNHFAAVSFLQAQYSPAFSIHEHWISYLDPLISEYVCENIQNTQHTHRKRNRLKKRPKGKKPTKQNKGCSIITDTDTEPGTFYVRLSSHSWNRITEVNRV